MNAPEAKFILRAHRGDGRYVADDPLFAEALAALGQAPELAAWLRREHAFDEAIAHQLDAVPPPAGLREAILVGARASRPRRRWWENPWWLAGAAAAITLAFAVPSLLRRTEPAAPAEESFGQFALRDLGTRGHGHDYPGPLAALEAAVAARVQPLTEGLPLTTDQLRAAGCAALQVDRREVFEICFQRDGTWYHLYVARRDRAGPAQDDRRLVFVEQDRLAAVTWTDGEHVFAVATRAGVEALRKVV